MFISVIRNKGNWILCTIVLHSCEESLAYKLNNEIFPNTDALNTYTVYRIIEDSNLPPVKLKLHQIKDIMNKFYPLGNNNVTND
jgi:hypothetical protein